MDTWVRRLDAAGFDDSGHRVLQLNDPTDNTLLAFVKLAEAMAATGLLRRCLAGLLCALCACGAGR